jgi:hypothetical protein
MTLSVFIVELKSTGRGILAKATNGSSDGPPCVWWILDEHDKDVKIGDKFILAIHKPGE